MPGRKKRLRMKRGFINSLVLAVWLTCSFTAPVDSRAFIGQPVSVGWIATASNGRRVMVSARDPQGLEVLKASQAAELVNYGAVSLWQLPAKPALAGQALLQMDPVEDDIYLRGITIQPQKAPPFGPENLMMAPPLKGSESSGFWMVQFIGPPEATWLQDLQDAGLENVAYLPNNAYLVWGSQPASTLAQLALDHPYIQWTGAYQPLYRLSPELRALADTPSSGEQETDVTIQFYNTEQLSSSLDEVLQLSSQVYQSAVALLNTTAVRVQLPAQQLATVANLPDVINIEPYTPPIMLDEIQGQILAGDLAEINKNVVSAKPGYLDWLKSKGFSTLPNDYPLVDLIDDGLDIGDASHVLHPDFYVEGKKSNPDRIAFSANCTTDPKGNSVGGHGNLNAGILAGYNALPGFPYQDSHGYQVGLGVSPYGQIASTKVFANNGLFDASRCNNAFFSIVNSAYNAGARITSNSWGLNNGGAYTVDAQTYDILTRDASMKPGNQEMLHIFAAGNVGPAGKSIGTPGTAKDVLTVGATENARDNGIRDGCGLSTSASADNVAIFSSRGPTADGRVKPDIMAPGTHIMGPASQDPAYNGSSVCGGYQPGLPPNPYYPKGQTLYTWSSGTSHAAPAISGIAQLVYYEYSHVFKPGLAPSPAMIKALILNTPRYLTGTDANDSLPSFSQGWGGADMSQIFDGTPRILTDQTELLTQTGDSYNQSGWVVKSNKAFHVSLVWTDAPGATTAGNALVNDLDLEVTVQGQTYHGNVFSGAQSVPGGYGDRLNNVENVFLPAGTSGAFEVRVIAHTLAGDGVPNNSDPIDQDFALVIYNGSTQPTGPQSLFFLPFITR